VKLGLFLSAFTSEPRKPLAVAGRAAAAGYEAVFVYDHLFPPGGPDRPSVEPYTLLAAAAAANPGLGVGVLVSRAGYRPLGILAKETSGLAHLTGGDAVLGLGLGDRFGRAEHEVAGLAFPPIEERTVLLEETALATRALLAGETWPGGSMTPAVRGPLLPPATAQVWLGGTSERVARAAARTADAWNGWGMRTDAFLHRCGQLAGWAREAGRDPEEVPPTWAGIVLVGADAVELASLEERRAEAGGSLDIWRGTVDDLRTLRDRIVATGATWMVPLAAGPPDRLDLIADTLRS
jgi:alkanesulfonate monooxygenase SsuD/methylene tetrahydromethanopterin reductase-like flavin-dependent oxidoreductase (luciferase family)